MECKQGLLGLIWLTVGLSLAVGVAYLVVGSRLARLMVRRLRVHHDDEDVIAVLIALAWPLVALGWAAKTAFESAGRALLGRRRQRRKP